VRRKACVAGMVTKTCWARHLVFPASNRTVLLIAADRASSPRAFEAGCQQGRRAQ
jgi:hypothetical protein